jgi:DNA-binding NtrC family response regulator
MPHVLVIDDGQDIREVMAAALQEAGYSVEQAADGEKGVECQRARPADVVITDIRMPNQNGYDMIAWLREQYPQVKVIAMTGGASSDMYLLAAREMGAHALLPKPFNIDQLLRIVGDVLR